MLRLLLIKLKLFLFVFIFVFLPSNDLLGHDLQKCGFCNVTKLKVLLHMHSSLDEHLYEINYMYMF
jgi:hypothetical protein